MEIKKEYVKLLNYAYRYLSYRMRTEFETRRYLTDKAHGLNINLVFVDKVITTLKEEHYINDSLFIEEFVNSRSKSKPKSAYALSLELSNKGINKNLIDSYFETNLLDESQLAYTALERKWRVFKTLPKEKKLQKSYDFLRRRGFSFSIIKKTIEEMESSE
jgi:regulatory protein